jgi:hypothetical protein
MDSICLQADRLHLKVYIVKACYNEEKNLPKSERSNWWWDEILALPKHYEMLVDRGTVEIVDTYPNLPLEYTPSGYFYRAGKLEWTGQLNISDANKVLSDLVQSL